MAKRTYQDFDGNSLTREEFCKYAGLALETVKTLYNQYGGDCISLMQNHGCHRVGGVRRIPVDPNTYDTRDHNGNPLTFDEYVEYMGYSRQYLLALLRDNDGKPLTLPSRSRNMTA